MLQVVLGLAGAAAERLVINELRRSYVLYPSHVHVVVQVDLENQGDDLARRFVFGMENREALHAGIVGASLIEGKGYTFEEGLNVSRLGHGRYAVQLRNPISHGDVVTVYLQYTLAKYQLFLRPAVQLNERIKLHFNATLAHNQVYEVKRHIFSVSGVAKMNRLAYSPELREQPRTGILTVEADGENDARVMEVEHTTDKAILVVENLTSRTYVSHWGTSKQEIYYALVNAGPRFVGEFNRIDFDESKSPCYIQQLPMKLPAAADAIWAGDDSGYLEKRLRLQAGGVKVPLRGPMLSSWRASFTVGWKIPTTNLVSGSYSYVGVLFPESARAPIIRGRSDIILPEGAEVKEVMLALPARVSIGQEIHNLDFRGRPVVQIAFEGLDTTLAVPVRIDYTLAWYFNWLKIVELSAAFLLVLLGVVIARRVDLSL